MTNWYSIFYWLTVADGIKDTTSTLVGIFSFVCVVSLVGLFISGGNAASQLSQYGDEDKDYKGYMVWKNMFKRVFSFTIILIFISSILSVAIPSKKDALIIIAGGSVGNFVTRDSSAKAIPSEVMLLLRTKIKEEINETSIKEAVTGEVDTLKNKSREELIQMLQKK